MSGVVGAGTATGVGAAIAGVGETVVVCGVTGAVAAVVGRAGADTVVFVTALVVATLEIVFIDIVVVATIGLIIEVVVAGIVGTIDVVDAIRVEELVTPEVITGVVIVGGTTGVAIIGATDTGAGVEVGIVDEAIQLPSDWLN